MFVVKKFIASFLMPAPLFVLLLLAGVYMYHKGRYRSSRWLIATSFVWIFLLSYAPFSSLMVESLERPYRAVDIPSIDARYIHILGSGHSDGEYLPLSSQISTVGVVRDLEGVLIHKAHKGTTLIFSGYGDDENLSVAQKNSLLAQALGVEQSDIILLEEAKDTLDEARMVHMVIGQEKLVLVTSAAHMKRADLIFRKMGIVVIPAPTDFKVKGREKKRTFWEKLGDLLTWPSAYGLGLSEIAFHEYIGLLWSWLRGDI